MDLSAQVPGTSGRQASSAHTCTYLGHLPHAPTTLAAVSGLERSRFVPSKLHVASCARLRFPDHAQQQPHLETGMSQYHSATGTGTPVNDVSSQSLTFSLPSFP